MDLNLIKSTTEDQVEMMMMMQMDKLPEFYRPYPEVADHLSSLMEFSCANGSSIESSPLIFDNTPVISPALTNPPSTIAFMGTAAQEEVSNVFSNPMPPGRLRNTTGELELSGASLSQKKNSMAAMREMIFRIAALQPIHIDPESVKPPKRRNVKISKDPQSVAARHRRERISERIRILQRLVPGGTKMDTASMLDEAIHYVKFLKTQVQSLERAVGNRPAGIGFPSGPVSNPNYSSLAKPYQGPASMFSHTQMLS